MTRSEAEAEALKILNIFGDYFGEDWFDDESEEADNLTEALVVHILTRFQIVGV